MSLATPGAMESTELVERDGWWLVRVRKGDSAQQEFRCATEEMARSFLALLKSNRKSVHDLPRRRRAPAQSGWLRKWMG